MSQRQRRNEHEVRGRHAHRQRARERDDADVIEMRRDKGRSISSQRETDRHMERQRIARNDCPVQTKRGVPGRHRTSEAKGLRTDQAQAGIEYKNTRRDRERWRVLTTESRPLN